MESDNSDEEDQVMAVKILESVRLGTGARITSLALWSQNSNDSQDLQEHDAIKVPESEDSSSPQHKQVQKGTKRKQMEVLGHDAVEKARELVQQAKKVKLRKDKKKKKKARKE